MPFPRLNLPITPPFPPMEARRIDAIPDEPGWQYEPKWDGFRAIAFRDGKQIALQSKSGQDLGRFFPEVLDALARLKHGRFIIDGELIVRAGGRVAFDALQLRLHPAASRIARLARETPATCMVFDLLYDGRRLLVDLPLSERRARLESFFAGERVPGIELSPFTTDRALAAQWLDNIGAMGLDGIIAKRAAEPYHSGDREGMVKIKRLRSADCVVAGFRPSTTGGGVGSLLLGLYDGAGTLHHVGSTSSFNPRQRREIARLLAPLAGRGGFSEGHAPGPSRWATARSTEFTPVQPSLVVEVRYDHFTADRFRHGTKFLRWRPDKSPRSCTFDQLRPAKRRRHA